MAWTNSRPFSALFTDILNGTAAFDLDTDTLHGALYNNTPTPDSGVASASTAYNAGVWGIANEQDDGTNWDAGGEPLTSVTVTQSTTTTTIDAADLSQGGVSTTLANVYGVLVYDNTLTTPVADQGVGFNYLGGANGVTGGTFTVQWAGTGLYTISTA